MTENDRFLAAAAEVGRIDRVYEIESLRAARADIRAALEALFAAERAITKHIQKYEAK